MTESLADATALILSGGPGTRLQSVVNDRPKVLAQVAGRPYLAYLFDQLVSAGLRRVVLCTGYRAAQVYDTFGDHYLSLDLLYSEETRPLGTAGALRLALPLTRSPTLLVLNGDSYCNADLRSFWKWHSIQRSAATLVLTHVEDARRYGRVKLDSDCRITQFLDRDSSADGGLINAGVYLLQRHLIAAMDGDREASLERDLFPRWVATGLYGFATSSAFIDIGTPESYAAADRFFSRLEPAA